MGNKKRKRIGRSLNDRFTPATGKSAPLRQVRAVTHVRAATTFNNPGTIAGKKVFVHDGTNEVTTEELRRHLSKFPTHDTLRCLGRASGHWKGGVTAF